MLHTHTHSVSRSNQLGTYSLVLVLLVVHVRPWPQTEKWEFHYGGMFFYCHYTYKCPGKCLQPSKKWFSWGALHLKKMARVAWKMAPKYQKNAKWPKITFRGPIPVPEVAFWGFGGLVCIEKWSRNFASGTRGAIFVTPQTPKTGSF